MPYAHSDKTMPMMTQRAPQQRPKLEGGKRFVMNTTFDPAGDQPTAIKELVPRRAAKANGIRFCLAPPAPARPSPWPR